MVQGILGPNFKDTFKLMGEMLGINGINDFLARLDFGSDPRRQELIEDLIKTFLSPLYASYQRMIETAGDNTEIFPDLTKTFMDQVFDNEFTANIAEAMGYAVMTPVMDVLKRFAEDQDANPEEFAAAFHGSMTLVTLPKLIIDAFRGSAIGTVIGPVGDAINALYFNLGLGFLGWQTFAPFLEAGLQARLRRHFNAKYGPNRFDLNTMIYLTVIGAIDYAELEQTAMEEGWRKQDINHVVNHSFRALTNEEILYLVNAGHMNPDAVKRELLKRGYSPFVVDFIQEKLMKEPSSTDQIPTLATAKKAFIAGIRSESEFRAILKSHGYGTEAVQLEIDIAKLAIRDSSRELNVGQIREAYVVRKISNNEVLKALKEIGYDIDDAVFLLNTWDVAKQPKTLRINQSTISKAFMFGTIDYARAIQLLLENGHTRTDAELILANVINSMKKAAPKIPISYLMFALSSGIITQQNYVTHMQNRGFSGEDINILIAVAQDQLTSDLTSDDIGKALKYKVIDGNGARTMLAGIGIDAKTIDLRVQTWEKERDRLQLKLSIPLIMDFVKKKVLTEGNARQLLVGSGLTTADAELVVKSINAVMPKNLTDNQVKELFTTDVIDANTASNYLVSNGLLLQDANRLVEAWKSAVGGITLEPTVNQLMVALQDEMITLEAFTEWLRKKGYTESAIQFYINLATAPVPEDTKELTKSDITSLYKEELMNYQDALARLIKDGYAPEDAELLLAKAKPRIVNSQVHTLYMSGFLEPEDFITILVKLGYSQQEITDYLTEIGFDVEEEGA